MNRTSNPRMFDPTRVFFSLPLAQAEQMASRVTAMVASNAAGSPEMLDERGHESLREALARELPNLSASDLLQLGAEVAGTAHTLAAAEWRAAAAEWRAAGHRPRETPSIGPSTLAGALLIHLHAGPESLPARLIATARQEHATLYKRRSLWPKPPPKEALKRWGQLHLEQEHAMYDYWRELLAQGTATP